MAYPFTKLPSVNDFKDKLTTSFDCCYTTKEVKVNGAPFKIAYFERSYNGKKLQCAVDFNSDTDVIPPSVVRRICAQLKIDTKLFGLHLD